MTFEEAMTSMFYTRLEEGDFYDRLEACEEYRDAWDEYSAARAQAGADVERLINAMNRIFDLQAHYIYRIGIQDALTMTRKEFATADLF